MTLWSILAGCSHPTDGAQPTGDTAAVACTVPQQTLSAPGCPGGGVPTDLYGSLVALGSGGTPCPDGACPGDAANIEVDVVNPCSVDIVYEVTCSRSVDSWLLEGPHDGVESSIPPCALTAYPVSVPAGETVQVMDLTLAGLGPGLYTITVDPQGDPQASALSFCMGP